MKPDSSMAVVADYAPAEVSSGSIAQLRRACDEFLRNRGLEVEPSIMNAKQRAQRAAANRRGRK